MVPGPFLSKVTGQRNLDSKLEFLKQKETTHKAASLAISRKIAGSGTANFPQVFEEVQN